MIETYHFPDADMLKETGPAIEFRSWQPDGEFIVLGNSDDVESSIFIEEVKKDKIKIVKRPTGGHAVYLSPKMISISLVTRKNPLPRSADFFLRGNTILFNTLEELGVKNLSLEGISVIAIANKKIIGTAIYRNRFLVFYHAILNLAEEPGKIAKYLKFPPKVPDYRKERPHSEFITSLWNEGYLLGVSEIKNTIENVVTSEKSDIF